MRVPVDLVHAAPAQPLTVGALEDAEEPDHAVSLNVTRVTGEGRRNSWIGTKDLIKDQPHPGP